MTKKPKPPADSPSSPPAKPLTSADLERMGFIKAKPTGRGYGLPAGPPPKKDGGE
jgi:hypothetical protein